jgi:hypothetical protein
VLQVVLNGVTGLATCTTRSRPLIFALPLITRQGGLTLRLDTIFFIGNRRHSIAARYRSGVSPRERRNAVRRWD